MSIAAIIRRVITTDLLPISAGVNGVKERPHSVYRARTCFVKSIIPGGFLEGATQYFNRWDQRPLCVGCSVARVHHADGSAIAGKRRVAFSWTMYKFVEPGTNLFVITCRFRIVPAKSISLPRAVIEPLLQDVNNKERRIARRRHGYCSYASASSSKRFW
jgi:hypothetical protein